ncbi:MAG: helix-turn-helix domain-containing protein [Luteolibacter sp.]
MAREKAGLSVDDVVFQTRLPQSAIEALEAEDFSRFASPVYAKSFLAQYSGFLNVDAAQWLDALKPAAYIEGNPLRPILAAGGTVPHEPMSRGEPRGGGVSALWLLLVSCGIVFGAIKVFELFEARFAGDLSHPTRDKRVEEPPTLEKPPMPVTPPKGKPVPDPNPPKSEDEAFRPAPRAIIVR